MIKMLKPQKRAPWDRALLVSEPGGSPAGSGPRPLKRAQSAQAAASELWKHCRLDTAAGRGQGIV